MKPKNHIAFYRPVTGHPIAEQRTALGHSDFDTEWTIGQSCDTFREIVANKYFRAESENHIYVLSLRLLVDPAKGSPAARFDRFSEVVGILIDKNVTVHCIENGLTYQAPVELWAMAFEAMKPANSPKVGRPTLAKNGLQQCHIDAARAIWFDRRYGTNPAALAAMNNAENRESTGAAVVGEWNQSRANTYFGKAERRKTIEEASNNAF